MPTYEFRCPDGHDFEKFYRSISAAPAEVQCPRCGAVATRLMSAGAGLVFKGSGFYITDYGKDGKKDQAVSPAKTEAAKPKAETPASTPSGSSDAKPAASSSSTKAAKE